MRKDITYKSKDNITDIHATIWIPTTEIKAIIQLSHGMVEHKDRYESLALHLNEQGFLVCANDHLGHGDSIVDKDHLGYFAAKDSATILVDDTYSLTKIVKDEYPNIPIFILGHSFGSFIIRNYLPKYSNEIDGVILSGTANHSKLKMNFAKMVASIISIYKGGQFYKSKYLEKATTGNFNKYFKNNIKFSWLTKDYQYLEDYGKDPKCRFRFTINAYQAMFTLIKNANKNYKNVKKDLPILLLSGKDDPVTDFGKSVIKLNNFYKKLKFTNVKYKIYNGLRHSIFNEKEKVIVINDLVQFINLNILKQKEN